MPEKSKRQVRKIHGPSPQGSGLSFLAVARVRRPFGVRGEVLLELLSDFPRQLLEAKTLYQGEDHLPQRVASIRRHGQDFLLLMEGMGDRDAVEPLRGVVLYLRAVEQQPLPPGVYYLHQIEGLEVVTDAGENLGRVREIIKTGANDVYVVQGSRGDVLLPAIPQVILEVRLGEGRMVVHLLEGLI
jgi:16S rRNA processing protein RimM